MPQARDEAGNIWETDAQGNAVRLISAAGGSPMGGIVTKAADPTRPYEAPKAAADLAIAQGKVAMTPAEVAKAQADAEIARLGVEKARIDLQTGDLEAKKDADAKRSRSANLRALQKQIERARELYSKNIKGGAPNALVGGIPNVFGLRDAIRPDIGQFNTAGSSLAEQAFSAFRVPGAGPQSDRDLELFVEANRPTATDSDLQIEEKLGNIQRRVEAALSGLGEDRPAAAIMGGIPNAAPPTGPAGPTEIDPTGGNPLLSPQDRAFLSANARSLGADGIRQYAAARGLQIPDNEIQAAVDYYSQGGQQDAVVNAPQGEGSLRGQVAASPFGSFAISAGDLASGGLLDEAASLAGGNADAVQQAIDLSRQQNPTASLLGSLAGGTVGALGAGKLVGAIPGIGARAASMGGGIVPDLLYGAAYGAGSAEDGERGTGALMGAGLSGAGNVIGRGIVGGIGRGVRGVSAPAIRYLDQAGIPMTGGQIMGGTGGVIGGTIKAAEDALSSIPGLGTALKNRRQEGIEGFNREALRQALVPIGAEAPEAVGNAGIGQAQGLVSNAYDSALSGVNLVPDAAYNQALSEAIQAGASLPGGLAGIFSSTMSNRVTPQFTEQGLSGRGLQGAIQGLRKDSGDLMRKGEIQSDLFRDATVDVENALMGLAERQAPGTPAAIRDANSAYRNLSIVEDAAIRGDNYGGVFTPAQLGAATKANMKRFNGKKGLAAGDAPMRELQQFGQDILPSEVPNSGTVDRALAAALLPVALGGTATGVATDYLSPEAAGGIGLLGALATRQGRNALQAALVRRPEAARAIGDQIYNNRQIGAMIGAPLLLGGSR